MSTYNFSTSLRVYQLMNSLPYDVRRLVNKHRFDRGFDYAEPVKEDDVVVGEYFINGYWNKTFQILSLNDNDTMTILWVDSGVVTTHGTPITKEDYHIVLAEKVKE